MFVSALLLAAAVTAVSGSSPPSPISCILTNGDRLSGAFVAATQATVRLLHPSLGGLTLRRGAIAVCESPDSDVRQQLGSLALAPLDRAPVVTVVLAVAQQQQIAEVPSQPVRLTRPRHTGRSLPANRGHVTWKRTLGTTYLLSRGNANLSDVGFTGGIMRKAERSKVTLRAKRQIGSRDGQPTENFFSATARYDRAMGAIDSVTDRPSFFTESIYEHDPFARVLHRAVENTGMSVPLSSDPRNNLALEIGAGVTHEAPTGARSYTHFGGLMRLAARQTLGGASADQEVAVFPDLTGPSGHYRVNGDINITAPIADGVSLKLSVTNRYDTRPQINVRKNDTTIQSGVGVEF